MNKKKLNNNGFSLVELIIVIAIMAVLIGVLAPTYMQYVEKSKKSNDVSTVDSILNACEVVAVDNEVTWVGDLTITLSTSADATFATTDTGDNVETKIGEIIDGGKLKSNAWGTITITAAKNASTGKVTFTYSSDGTENMTTYSTTLGARF